MTMKLYRWTGVDSFVINDCSSLIVMAENAASARELLRAAAKSWPSAIPWKLEQLERDLSKQPETFEGPVAFNVDGWAYQL